MTEKRNWNEIEARLNFESVSEKLRNLSASGKLKRRKSAGDLLDKVKDALLKARADGASFAALAAFLAENGLPVSEPTLRQYLHAQGAVRKRPSRKISVALKPDTQSVSKPRPDAKPKPEEKSLQSLIDRNRADAASSNLHPYEKRDGPHIADVRNL